MPTIALARGVFTLSLDFELIWGYLDLEPPFAFRAACERERAQVIERLLALLCEFGVSATWCVVGHLLLERCAAVEGRKHPDLPRPQHAWCRRDWYALDPGADEQSQPLFYARSLVEKIQAARPRQEIGCHTFSHVIFGDAGCAREVAVAEVRESLRLARELGIEMRSFVFPRNQAGHLEVLREFGFSCYRGVEPQWYRTAGWPLAVQRLAHGGSALVAGTPPVSLPQRDASGLWNLPASMLYFPMHGWRRLVPVSRRVRRAQRGLDAAAQQGRVFHLWFHPTNLADGTEAMFTGLRAILAHAERLRSRGELEFLSMGELAARCAAETEKEIAMAAR